jgi:hypothetical protein
MIFKQFILFTFLTLKKYTYLFTSKNKLFFSNTNEGNTNECNTNEGNTGNSTNTSISSGITTEVSTGIPLSISRLEIIPSNALMYKYIYLPNINFTNKIKLLKTYNIVIPKNNTSISGMDNRYNKTFSKNNTEINKIIDNERKKRLLDNLMNPYISKNDKLKLLEDNDIINNDIKVINILRGGLTRDW